MSKQEFMTLLKQTLVSNKNNNINDIILDYEEHFTHALAEGKSEEEICKKLGNPETIAHAYETESMIVKIKDPSSPFKLQTALTILGRLLIIAPFNFFVLAIPGAISLALIMAGWSMALAVFSIGLGVIVGSFQASLFSLSGWLSSSIVLSSLGLFSLTVCLSLFMFFITKNALLLAINYLQWNLKFILEK